MKVTVDKNICIGCGACVAIAPKSFKMKAGKAEPIVPPKDKEETIREAADSCPVQAIQIK